MKSRTHSVAATPHLAVAEGGVAKVGPVRAAAAYGGLALTIVVGAATAGLYATTHSTPVDLGIPRVMTLAVVGGAISFAAVGAVVLLRRPGNPVGWVFWGTALLVAVATFAQEFAVYAVIARSTPLWGGAAAAWFQSWSLLSALTTGVGLLLALFPDGRVLGPRWRVVPWALIVGFLCFAAGYVLDAGPVNDPFASVSNPFAIAGFERVSAILLSIGFFLSWLSIPAAAISLVLRFRRASGVGRQQIKWLAAAGAVLAVSLTAALNLESSKTGEAIAASVVVAALVALPVAAGVAILRYRLYEIDVVINRTLVYGSVTTLLAGTYIGLVLLLQLALRPVTKENGLAIALSTLVVAALFRPARNRVQALIDRRFYRRKYDAERTLQAFATRLRDEVDLDALRAELTSVVAETMQPAHVSLWLRAPETLP